MAFSSGKEGFKKPKLPRKRKKAAIKVQGRKWYYDTIKLYQITGKSNRFYEPICKFWVNSRVTMKPHVLSNDEIRLLPTPAKYW
jgi:hypothetical protein